MPFFACIIKDPILLVDMFAFSLILYGPMLIGFAFIEDRNHNAAGSSTFAAWGLAFLALGYALSISFALGIGILLLALVIVCWWFGSPRERKMTLLGACWGLAIYGTIGLYFWWRFAN